MLRDLSQGCSDASPGAERAAQWQVASALFNNLRLTKAGRLRKSIHFRGAVGEESARLEKAPAHPKPRVGKTINTWTHPQTSISIRMNIHDPWWDGRFACAHWADACGRWSPASLPSPPPSWHVANHPSGKLFASNSAFIFWYDFHTVFISWRNLMLLNQWQWVFVILWWHPALAFILEV